MDGVSLNRIPPTRLPSAAGGAVPSAAETLATIRQDALSLSAGVDVPAGGAAPQAGASGGNPALVAAAARRDADTAQASGNMVRAQQLRNFAVIIETVKDPAAASALAQAYRNPQANNPGAQRLQRVLLGPDSAPVMWLVGMLAFDGPNSAQWRAGLPNSIFNGDVTGARLTADMVNEIMTTSNCGQGNRQTCAATTVQGILAGESPAEYIKIVTSLAAYGKADLQSGKVIQRTADWNFQGDGDRSLSSRLIQPALMASACGGYDNTRDVSGTSAKRHVGVRVAEMEQLLSDVTARKTHTVKLKEWDARHNTWAIQPQAEDPLVRMRADFANGWAVPVLLSLRSDQAYGHYERVTAVTPTSVTCVNPWGYSETMSVDQFRQRLVAAFYQ